ncbi:Dual specificity phosphatases (DSP): Ser/Thr [Pacmanvirus A23]|uniref:Dual specificity phosphatases (DSP): Ser/Thr n=1 Tax=Pacmanvirus A23 TaxID=1932881 RepID=UPI000A092914|nr:Dual specificity phosphatases (DSP): Ser/Thr [Pacmanvirus A23]SIP85743.1 Dual specificity phosphatases (DSP): Ser/Thr [Pacmanvirus A23]
MTSMDKSRYAKVAEGVWVGNCSASTDLTFLADADISAIINLCGSSLQQVEDVDYFEYVLPNEELIESEFPRVLSKLESISQYITMLRNNKRCVLISCNDGKNKCMIAAGYYLINVLKQQTNDVIWKLESLYFTPNEIQEELAYNKKVEAFEEIDSKSFELMNARKVNKCLTMASFKRILKIKK